METMLFVWWCLAGVFVIALFADLFRRNKSKHGHLVGIGNEREELYLPGDPDPDADSDMNEEEGEI